MSKKQSYLSNMANLGIMNGVHTGNIVNAPTGHFGIGLNSPNFDASSPLVLPPVKAIVLAGPEMYADDPVMLAAIKNMVECCSKTITGIPLNYTLETDTTVVGFDGQSLSFPKRTTRAGVNPSITYQELLGNPIWNIHRKWITDIRDPDTMFSFVGMKNKVFVTSTYSMTLLFIQYDVTGVPNQIVDGFIVSNMFPTETTELGSEKGPDSKGMERTIGYTGLMHHTAKTRETAVRVADVLQAHTVKYFEMENTPYGIEDVAKNISKDLGVLGDIAALI